MIRNNTDQLPSREEPSNVMAMKTRNPLARALRGLTGAAVVIAAGFTLGGCQDKAVESQNQAKQTEVKNPKSPEKKPSLGYLESKESLSAYIEKREAELQKEYSNKDENDPEFGEKGKSSVIYNDITNEIYQILKKLDNESLKRVIAIHFDSNKVFVASGAVSMVKADNNYFKKLFNNPNSHRIVRLRALERINDESFMLNLAVKGVQNESIEKKAFKDKDAGKDIYSHKKDTISDVIGFIQSLRSVSSYKKVLKLLESKSQKAQKELYSSTILWLKAEIARLSK